MDQTTLIVLVVAIALIVAIGFWMYSRNRRSTELRERFGPEYHRTVEEYGDKEIGRASCRERV